MAGVATSEALRAGYSVLSSTTATTMTVELTADIDEKFRYSPGSQVRGREQLAYDLPDHIARHRAQVRIHHRLRDEQDRDVVGRKADGAEDADLA